MQTTSAISVGNNANVVAARCTFAGNNTKVVNRVAAASVPPYADSVDTHGLTPVALAKEGFIYIEGCMPSNSL
jgi:hypothetical protein